MFASVLHTKWSMVRLRDYPIVKQLTWLNLLVTTAALLLSRSAFLVHEVITSRKALVRNVSVQTQIIGSNTASALLFDYPESAEDTLSALRASRNILYTGWPSLCGVLARWQGENSAPTSNLHT
jgi:Periplasmic sensor domain